MAFNIRYLFSERQTLDETFIPWLLGDFISWLNLVVLNRCAVLLTPVKKPTIRSWFPVSCGENM